MNMTFAWTPDISVNDEVLDNQHKQMLQSLNKLFGAMIDGDVGVIAQWLSHIAREDKKYAEFVAKLAQ